MAEFVYLHSDNSWLPSSEPKTHNNVDLSWLPNYNDSNLQLLHSDDSWLPDTKPKSSLKTEKDSDDSWLPSVPAVRNKTRENHAHESYLPNYNKNNGSTKSDHSGRYRKAETGVDYSWLPSTSIVNNGDKKKEHKVLNKHASLPSVETDSLGGVSTLLRRWKDVETRRSKPESCSNNNDHKTHESLVDPVPVSLKPVNVEKESVRVGKPRLIRGRQAFIDFLNMVEQDKRRELESLTKRKAVSKFPNRGRIQALLHVRFIRIRAENLKEAKTNKHSVSKTMKSIWDKFNTGVKQDIPASRKVKSNVEEMKKTNTSPEYSVDCSPSRELTATATATTAASSQEPVSTTASLQSAQEDAHSEILLSNEPDYQQKSQCHSAEMFSSGIENCHQWVSEYSQTQSDWDDEEEEDGYYSYNWISDVARPRSDWECMRQKRYQEMLHLQPSNQDISQLLERKSVSGFLSSDQRNLLDQLMVSRAQGVSRTESRKLEEKKEEPAPEQRSRHQHRCRQNNNTSQSSFINHPSIEMEVIYDLRGYMEQIHQEVMELRKVVTSYVNMQVKNQHQSIQKKRSEQPSPTHNCCVCYTMQADSFMYRCGHMCACYDCGLELQCTTGKCPICDDTILDVVRANAYGD